jgi:uncharacterized membrane protein YozB (DUF420 family)
VIAYALDASGFLTHKSSVGADVTLLLSAAVIVLLTAGVVLARRRRYEAHRWVQTSAVALNAVLAAFWMAVSLARFILPGIPASLSEHGHTLAAVHAAVGVAAAALGIFLVIRANQLTRRGKSVSRYKTTMRVTYFVYLAAFVLGVWLYVMTYG